MAVIEHEESDSQDWLNYDALCRDIERAREGEKIWREILSDFAQV